MWEYIRVHSLISQHFRPSIIPPLFFALSMPV